MRSAFKKLIQKILAYKLRRLIQQENIQIIVVLGNKFRAVFRDELFAALKDDGFDVTANVPGYNYFLGIPLQIMGFRSAYQSIYQWINLVFKRPEPRAKIFIQEFAYNGNEKEYHFIFNVLLPKIVVITDGEFDLKDTKGVIVLRPSDFTPEYVEVSDQGMVVKWTKSSGESMNKKIVRYGTHYGNALVCADRISELIRGDYVSKKKS